MLAPRKTLWSTPEEVIAAAIDWVASARSTDDDEPSQPLCVYDIGCGDGRVILQWAEFYSSCENNNSQTNVARPSFCGIDIDADRIEQAKAALDDAIRERRIDPTRVTVTFVCANALQDPGLIQNATVLFLYLIPRGLRRILEQPDFLDNCAHLRYLVTYMSPLPKHAAITPLRQERIAVPHQPGAAWPLYLYQWEERRKEDDNDSNNEQPR